MKYSSCEFKGPSDTLEAAETRTLENYLRHLQVDATVRRVLDIGCGWGSFSLYAAKKYPDVQFVCFSNSKTQKQFIMEQARERGISNLKVLKADINDMSLETLGEKERFDRCVSIECLEHSKNYEEIFARVRGMLHPNGRCFFQLLCHREYTYHMSNDSWMGRNFFTGGTIPSAKLFYFFNRNLVVEDQVIVDGRQYARTLDAWLERMYQGKDMVMKALATSKEKPDAALEFQRWRMFYLMSSAAFGINKGQDWMVTYLVMVPRVEEKKKGQ
jgi:cyclopropane-fatty-acyl-phospholipid synthase